MIGRVVVCAALAAALAGCAPRQPEVTSATPESIAIQYDARGASMNDITKQAEEWCSSHGRGARLQTVERNDVFRFALFHCVAR